MRSLLSDQLGSMMNQDATANYRGLFDTPLSGLINAMWEGHWHLGLFASPDESLSDAQMRAKRRMAELAGIRPGQSILEVACGVGGTARYLARNHDVHVVATNITEAQLQTARQITQEEGLSDRINFEIADYHHLAYADASFDGWWCQEALLYSDDKSRVLREAARIVKPGGFLILSDLTLSDEFQGPSRSVFEAAMKTYLVSSQTLDSLVKGFRFEVVERHDWSSHAVLTFQHVLTRLERAADTFRQSLGNQAVDDTFYRVRTQLELAKDGLLGWQFYSIRRE